MNRKRVKKGKDCVERAARRKIGGRESGVGSRDPDGFKARSGSRVIG